MKMIEICLKVSQSAPSLKYQKFEKYHMMEKDKDRVRIDHSRHLLMNNDIFS